jgi:hypothetical protein
MLVRKLERIIMGYGWEDEASALEMELFDEEMELLRGEDLFANYEVDDE